MNNDLFTIVLLHFNQSEYLENALDKIFIQNYPNIQLIISDDYSKDFNTKKVEKYVDQQKGKNIKKVSIKRNKENLGTVQNLNSTLDLIEGKYVIFIAADDELDNSHVISDIYSEFEKKSKETNLYIFQTDMYDKELKGFYYKFLDQKVVDNYKVFDKKDYLNILCKGCFFPSGSTVYRSYFIKEKKFDERFKIIEDWPMYLYCANNNVKMDFSDYVVLKHRDGGISHSEETTKFHTMFIMDIYNVYELLVVPILNKINIANRFWVVRTYKFYLNKYGTNNHVVKPKDMTYKITNYILILFYNFINLKNSINKSKYLGYSLIMGIMYLLNISEGINLFSKVYLLVVFFLIVINIIYDIVQYIYNILNRKNIEREKNRR